MAKFRLFFILTAVIVSAFFIFSVKAALVGNTSQATLTASPQTGTYAINNNFSVGIYVNTNGQSVVVVAAYLNYDTTHFEAVSIDTTGSVFTIEAEKIIDSTNGVIKITRGIPAPGVNTANGLVATINFRATAATTPGSDNLNFQFTAGSTLESNVILNDGLGTDYLSGVYNAKYTVSGGTGDTTPPTVSITAPSSGATVSGTSVTVSANASDDVGVAGVQFKLDGNNLGSEDLTSPYSITWNTTQTTNGSHTLTATARDAAGNQTTSSGIPVTVSNGTSDTTPPTVSITAPSSGATVSGTSVTVSANASDNVGVAGVQFKLDGNNLGSEDVTSPYSITWNTTGASNGSHTLTATARDAAGNQTTSGGIPVTVSNATSDTQAPTTPTNFVATVISSSQVNLSWSASTDNVEVVGYHIYRNSVEIATTPYTSYSSTGLQPSTTYTYAVSAYDAAGNGSYASESRTVTTLAGGTPPPSGTDNTPPGNITDLSTSDITNTSVKLKWSAPGDDGYTGEAKSYNLRYSTITITDSNWNSATQVSGMVDPVSAGSPQSMIVTGLSAGTTYYFAIKTLDEASNISGLSNVVWATTQGGSQPKTCTSFTYSEWSACQPNSTQSRTVVSATPQGCSGGNPILSQSCYYAPSSNTCTSFTYSGWSTCQPNSTQSRTIVSAKPVGCSGGSPILSRSCTYTASGKVCSGFTYSDWSVCQPDGTQLRTVVSTTPVGCSGGNPVLLQTCTYTPGTTEEEQKPSLFSSIKNILTGLLSFVDRLLSYPITIYVVGAVFLIDVLIILRIFRRR